MFYKFANSEFKYSHINCIKVLNTMNYNAGSSKIYSLRELEKHENDL